jgi:hypothetical protein
MKGGGAAAARRVTLKVEKLNENEKRHPRESTPTTGTHSSQQVSSFIFLTVNISRNSNKMSNINVTILFSICTLFDY